MHVYPESFSDPSRASIDAERKEAILEAARPHSGVPVLPVLRKLVHARYASGRRA